METLSQTKEMKLFQFVFARSLFSSSFFFRNLNSRQKKCSVDWKHAKLCAVRGLQKFRCCWVVLVFYALRTILWNFQWRKEEVRKQEFRKASYANVQLAGLIRVSSSTILKTFSRYPGQTFLCNVSGHPRQSGTNQATILTSLERFAKFLLSKTHWEKERGRRGEKGGICGDAREEFASSCFMDLRDTQKEMKKRTIKTWFA